LVKPLINLLKKGVLFSWTSAYIEFLNALIKQITNNPILTASNKDKPFELETDVSSYAIGAILFQKNEREKRRAIGYASRTLNKAE
jgi:RNase H-like domain found in reverse transcriptase